LTNQSETSIIPHNLRKTNGFGTIINIMNMQHQAFGTYIYFYLGTMPGSRLLGATQVVDSQ
jgi:hypothetical protein